jgi:hypothetical protein
MEKTPLEIARQRRREKIDRGEKIERLDPIEKSRRSPNSLRFAINAKCWDCCGGDTGGTVERIRNCPCGQFCPLWNLRPYQTKEK